MPRQNYILPREWGGQAHPDAPPRAQTFAAGGPHPLVYIDPAAAPPDPWQPATPVADPDDLDLFDDLDDADEADDLDEAGSASSATTEVSMTTQHYEALRTELDALKWRMHEYTQGAGGKADAPAEPPKLMTQYEAGAEIDRLIKAKQLEPAFSEKSYAEVQRIVLAERPDLKVAYTGLASAPTYQAAEWEQAGERVFAAAKAYAKHYGIPEDRALLEVAKDPKHRADAELYARRGA